jgi:hypothetical protein
MLTRTFEVCLRSRFFRSILLMDFRQFARRGPKLSGGSHKSNSCPPLTLELSKIGCHLEIS